MSISTHATHEQLHRIRQGHNQFLVKTIGHLMFAKKQKTPHKLETTWYSKPARSRGSERFFWNKQETGEVTCVGIDGNAESHMIVWLSMFNMVMKAARRLQLCTALSNSVFGTDLWGFVLPWRKLDNLDITMDMFEKKKVTPVTPVNSSLCPYTHWNIRQGTVQCVLLWHHQATRRSTGLQATRPFMLCDQSNDETQPSPLLFVLWGEVSCLLAKAPVLKSILKMKQARPASCRNDIPSHCI